MKISSFGINIDKSKRLWALIGCALIIAVIFIIISYVHIYSKKNMHNDNDLFNISSYYAKYSLNVVSNKNHNSYDIEEWYLKKDKDEYYRFDFEDEDKNKASYVLGNNTLHITKSDQISGLELENYTSKKSNLISIITFFNIYNEIVLSKTNDIKVEKKTIDTNTMYTITIEDLNKLSNEYNYIFSDLMKIHKLEILIDNNMMLPLEYLVFNEKDEIIIQIKYEKFEIMEKIDDKIFANLNK